jgi:hypothetical protein
MALTKITANIIEDGAISTASLADTSITADKLHTTLDLTGKSVTVATATAGDNDTTVASTAFVSTAIANLADSAPATLDTLNELAAALGDDANFSTTVTNSIALKAPLASPDFTGDATFDTSTLVIDSTNNRVGIGTTSPASPLQVNVASDQNIGFQSVGGNPRISAYNDAVNISLDLNFNGANLKFETGGVEAMRIESSGQILITNETPSIKLVDSGDNSAQFIQAYGGYLRYYADDNNILSGSEHSWWIDGGRKMTLDSSGRLGINRTPSITNSKLEVAGADNVPLINVEASGYTGGIGIGPTGLQLFHGSTAHMQINSSGNVGIGTPPSERLHILGGGNGPEIRLENSSGSHYIRAYDDNWNFLANSTNTAMTIRNDGQVEFGGPVGIGTGGPAAPLDVVSNSSAIGIDLRGRSSDNIGQLSFESYDSGTTYSQIQSRSTELLVKTIANIPMSFHTNNTERMRIDPAGVVIQRYYATDYYHLFNSIFYEKRGGRHQGVGTYNLFTNGQTTTQSSGYVRVTAIYATPSGSAVWLYKISGNRTIHLIWSNTGGYSGSTPAVTWNSSILQVSNGNSSVYYAVEVELINIGNTWSVSWGNFPGFI